MKKYRRMLIIQAGLLMTTVVCMAYWPTFAVLPAYAAGWHSQKLAQWVRAMEVSQ